MSIYAALSAAKVAGSGFSLYNLVDPATLDGLILAADLGHGVSQDQIEQLCARFHPLPMVALSLEVPGIPSVQTDSFNGMRQAVLHLIEAHGLRRIAFVRGPHGQSEAEQRYRAYVSALEAHGIPLDEQLVAAGDFHPESGRAAIALLVDERHAEFQAVVTANDRMAIGALDALQGRGRQVPAEIALVGFDDITEAQALGVPLTTVHQPFYATGQQAVQQLLRLLHGEAVPSQTILPTELIIRWSCGCLPPAIQQVRCDEALLAAQS